MSMGDKKKSKHDSWITKLGKKFDLVYHLTGGDDGKYHKLLNEKLPREVNRAGADIVKPFAKVDKKINPLRKIDLYDKIATESETRPGDAAAAAVGAFFGGSALMGAMGGAGGSAAGGVAGGTTTGGTTGALGGATTSGTVGGTTGSTVGGTAGAETGAGLFSKDTLIKQGIKAGASSMMKQQQAQQAQQQQQQAELEAANQRAMEEQKRRNEEAQRRREEELRQQNETLEASRTQFENLAKKGPMYNM